MRNPTYSNRHPVMYAILLTLLVLAVYVAAGAAATILKLPVNTFFLYANILLFILALVFLSAARGGRNVGLRGLRSPRDWLIFWLAFIPPIVNLVYGIVTKGLSALSIGQIAIYFFLALLVGFNEEVFFRGLMLKPLALRGPWRAAIITSILFAIAHALNVLAGSDPIYVGLQIGYALAIGFGYAAMALTAGTIYPLILAHFLTDFTGFLPGGTVSAAPTTAEYVIAGVYVVAFIGYGVYLITQLRSKPKSMI